MKKYGLIGTCYNMGISHIAAGFAEQLNMKTLLVDNKPFAKFPERFKNYQITVDITDADINWLLTDIDVLMAIETPYNWKVFEMAKARGIKTVFMPMIEWLNRQRPELQFVDMFICPSTYTYDLLPSRKRVLVPCEVPVDMLKFAKYKSRHVEKARVFFT